MEQKTVRDDGAGSLRDRLAHHGREFYEHGWMMATAGNLSARTDSGEVVITATGRHKGELGAEDFVRCGVDELLSEETAEATSSDSVIHHAIYEHVPGAAAVYHVHEPHAVAASIRSEDDVLEFEGFPMVKALGIMDVEQPVTVPILPDRGRAEFVADGLRDVFADAAGDLQVPAVVAERHGLYAWGESPFAARRHIEALAHLCECETIAATE